jgi:predicted Holliday junction resolvase-like endonuclease
MSDILNKMRIKSFLIIPLILVLLLLSTPKVFAEELQNNSFTDKQQKLQENREKSQERMQNLQEKKEQLQKITEERKQKNKNSCKLGVKH